MSVEEPIRLECFYPYGFQGRAMMAVRAPFAMANDAAGIVGRIADIDGARYRIVAVRRQISGPIAKGEPIGVEVDHLGEASP